MILSAALVLQNTIPRQTGWVAFRSTRGRAAIRNDSSSLTVRLVMRIARCADFEPPPDGFIDPTHDT